MSDESIAVVKRIYEGFDTGDMEKILECVAEEIAMDHRGIGSPDYPMNKVFRGKSGMREFVNLIFDTEEVLDHEVREFFASGDKVAVTGFFRARVKATNKEFSSDWAQVWTTKQGLATEWKLYFDFTAEALAYRP